MYNEKKEIKEAQIEVEVLNKKTEVFQNTLADDIINNGLGEEIIYTLNNPIKLTKFKIFKLKVKEIINRIFDTL